ncbi:MAG: hypothetical protein ACI4SR_02295 [Faecalibacillus sp.]
MSKFDRKVGRTKKEYQFTQKTNIPEKQSVFKENFNLRWIRFNIPTVIGFILDFVVTTLVVIPLLMSRFNSQLSFVLGHGLITGLLIVLTVCIINKEKPQLSAFLVRYLFIGLLIGTSAYLSLLLTAWLS